MIQNICTQVSKNWWNSEKKMELKEDFRLQPQSYVDIVKSANNIKASAKNDSAN
jgi:hypothetical protein